MLYTKEIEQENLHEAQPAQPFADRLEAAAATTPAVPGHEYTANLHPQIGVGFGMELDVITVSGLDHVGVSAIQPGAPAHVAGVVDGDVVRGMAGVQFPVDGQD